MSELIKITGELPAVETEGAIALGLAYLESLKNQVKKIEIEFKAEAMAFMRVNGIKQIEISDHTKIILATKKTDRFESDFIKEKLGFTERQLAVLPKNPAWKKTAVLADADISCAHSIEEKDELEIKLLDDRFIK